MITIETSKKVQVNKLCKKKDSDKLKITIYRKNIDTHQNMSISIDTYRSISITIDTYRYISISIELYRLVSI